MKGAIVGCRDSSIGADREFISLGVVGKRINRGVNRKVGDRDQSLADNLEKTSASAN